MGKVLNLNFRRPMALKPECEDTKGACECARDFCKSSLFTNNVDLAYLWGNCEVVGLWVCLDVAQGQLRRFSGVERMS